MRSLIHVFLSAYLLHFGVAQNSCGYNLCCYGELGCFTSEPPFDRLPLPESPEVINPTLLLVTPHQPPFDVAAVITLDPENDAQHIDLTRETIVVVHGWAGGFKLNSWIHDYLLKWFQEEEQKNLIVLDWEDGADLSGFSSLSTLPLIYTRPASNCRVAAAWAVLSLRKLGVQPADLTCVGFSLGAQVCGFMGKEFAGEMKRISAIDAAGPFFWRADPAARIHHTDAKYVDGFHGSFVGIVEPIGDVDFYANNGRTQPMCPLAGLGGFEPPQDVNPDEYLELMLKTAVAAAQYKVDENVEFIVTQIVYMIGCSHLTTPRIYDYTILSNSTCDFAACPCGSGEAWENGECSCRNSVLPGWRSYTQQPHQNKRYHFQTALRHPYCK